MLVKTIEFNVTVKNTVLNIEKEISLPCDTEDVLQEIRLPRSKSSPSWGRMLLSSFSKIGRAHV